MRLFASDHHEVRLPAGHPFPIDKYRRLRERLVAEGIASAGEIEPAPPATAAQLARVHDAEYLERVVYGALSEPELRRIGFPWSPELVQRALHSVGGTVAACRAALADGLAVNLAGGTHHAGRGHGAGFCVFNDVMAAVRDLQDEGLLERVVILDCDVHQGDGTATLAAGDDRVFTFSIHGANNFPVRKANSDLDVALPNGSGDDEYLEALAPGLESALDTSRAELAVYLAGADPFAGDRYGRLALSKDGLARRDRLVLEACRAHRLPVAVVLAGGYARDLSDVVDIHVETVRLARAILGR